MRAFRLVVGIAIAASLALPAAAAPVTVLVTVRNQDGSPVQGGSASMADHGVGESKEGQFAFRFGYLAPGEHLFSYAGDIGTIVLRVLHIPEGQAQVALVVRLGEEVVVRGKVVAGDPPMAMPFAQVKLTDGKSGAPIFPTQVVASAEGAFVLDGQEFANVRMQANLPYHKPSEWVPVKPPCPMQTELRCPPETVVLGWVLDESGSPVPDAGIVCVAPGYVSSVRSDRDGRFECRSLPPGRCRFTAAGPYRVPTGVTLDLRDGQQLLGMVIRLRYAPLFTFFGRVVEPDGATGIQGAQVIFTEHLMPQGLDGRPVNNWAGFLHAFEYCGVTDRTGYFDVNLPWREDDPQGHLWFPEVTADGYLTGRFAVRVDRTSSEWLSFPMFRGGRLRADIAGVPDGAQVEMEVQSRCLPPLTEPHSVATYRATLDAATGQFDFGLVQPGEHWLVVRQRGDILGKMKVTVKEGEETTVRLTLPSASPP